MRTIRCTACDTYNRLYRPTCMACGRAMQAVVTGRVLVAQASLRTARFAVALGRVIAAIILLVSMARHGAQPNPSAGLHAAAAIGFGHTIAYLADWLADWLQPDGEPDWREIAQIIEQIACDLAAHDDSLAVDQLDRHGGIKSLAYILAAVGRRADDESNAASRHGDRDEADHQAEVCEAIHAAVWALLADQARRTNRQ